MCQYKKTNMPKGFKFHTVIDCFEVTLWQWKGSAELPSKANGQNLGRRANGPLYHVHICISSVSLFIEIDGYLLSGSLFIEINGCLLKGSLFTEINGYLLNGSLFIEINGYLLNGSLFI